MQVVIEVPENEIPTKQDIISVAIHFMDGKIVECDYPFTELEQEPKTGKWMLQPSNKEQGERDFIWWKCSECGQVIYSETEKDRREFHAFCSRCGAKMT